MWKRDSVCERVCERVCVCEGQYVRVCVSEKVVRVCVRECEREYERESVLSLNTVVGLSLYICFRHLIQCAT